jgi:hypothetical protein
MDCRGGGETQHPPFAEREALKREIELGRVPPTLHYVYTLKALRVGITLTEYERMAALNVDDLLLWAEAEYQREKDEDELRRKETERNGGSRAGGNPYVIPKEVSSQ